MTEPRVPRVESQLQERLETVLGEGGSGGSSSEERLRQLAERKSGGRYRLEGEVGRGGMGAVLRVFDTDLRRHLAMKVMLGDERAEDPVRVGRFLEEAQVTGQLEHPGIVPVYELGVDQDRRVYFTMRLVRGRSLAEVLRLVERGEEGWSLTRVVGVLQRVGETMAYAHDHGVVHRDLKPDNVMVGAYGEVYVMDWGLARVVGREETLTESGVRTDRREAVRTGSDSGDPTLAGTVLGTPGYMSPEQASGDVDAVGPLSDVFSAGAMLYRALAGRRPFGEPGDSPYEVVKRSLVGPPPPLHGLAPDVPAELVAICERAMAFDPTERYADMRALADDLRAYLEGRVVRAYETGAVAELRKWVRRNRGLAAASAAALVFLVVGLAGIGWVESHGRQRLERVNRALEVASEQARREAATSREVVDFMTSMFALQEPDQARGQTVTVKEVLDRASAGLANELGDEPEIRARLTGTMGLVYGSLGLFPESERLLGQWVDLEHELGGPQSVGSLQARRALAQTLELEGRYDEALPRYESLLADLRREAPGERALLARTLVGLAVLERNLGQRGEAEAHVGEALELLRGPDGGEPVEAEQLLATLHADAGRFAEALEVMEASVGGARERLGDDHPGTLSARHALATAYAGVGRFDEALAIQEAVVADSRRVNGPQHPSTLQAANALAFLLLQLGRVHEAVEVHERAIEAAREVLGENHHYVLTAQNKLATSYRQAGRLDEAAALFERTVDGFLRGFGERHAGTAATLNNLGLLQLAQGRYDEAEATFQRALAIRQDLFGEEHPETVQGWNNLALCLRQQGRYEEALPIFERVVASFEALRGPSHPDTVTALDNLGVVLFYLGRVETALATFEEELALAEPALGTQHPILCRTYNNLGAALVALERREEGLEMHRRALACREATLGPGHPDTLSTLGHLGRLSQDAGRYEEAEALLRRYHEGAVESLGEDHPNTLEALRLLGRLYRETGRIEPAEAAFSRAATGLRAAVGPAHPRAVEASLGLIGVWADEGRRAEALELASELEALLPPERPERARLDELLERLRAGED